MTSRHSPEKGLSFVSPSLQPEDQQPRKLPPREVVFLRPILEDQIPTHFYCNYGAFNGRVIAPLPLEARHAPVRPTRKRVTLSHRRERHIKRNGNK